MLDAFLSLLRGDGPAERPIWTADLSYWIAGEHQRGAGDPAWDTEAGYLALHRELGLFPYYEYTAFWLAEPRFEPGIELSVSREGDRTTATLHTPVGELTEISVFLPTSCSTGVLKHFVETEADLRILLYALERRELRPANLADYPARRARWAEAGGLPSIALPRSPLSALAYEWAGVQALAYLLADCRPLVEAALALMEAQEAPVLDAVCAAAPPLVHFADNLSSDNFTSLYAKYLEPTHRRRIERLHAAGVACAVHLDGTVRGLLPRLARVGFDAVEALTPRPAGDLDVATMRQVAGNADVILWGGVPGVMFAPPFTWPAMQAHIARVLAAWRGQPFVLGVADQIPPDGDISFCPRIAEMLAA